MVLHVESPADVSTMKLVGDYLDSMMLYINLMPNYVGFHDVGIQESTYISVCPTHICADICSDLFSRDTMEYAGKPHVGLTDSEYPQL